MANDNDKQEERLGCHHEYCEEHCDEYWESDDHCNYYGGYCCEHETCPKKCKKHKKYKKPCKCYD